MTIKIRFIRPRSHLAMLGLIPSFLNEDDPRPAREQFNENYAHGGGWSPIKDFKLKNGVLLYPGDPPFWPFAEISFRDEKILVCDYAMVCIVQPDGKFEVARMD
jgi:hypothetical protein